MPDNYEQWCERIKPAIEQAGDSATVIAVLTDAREQYRDLCAEKSAADEKITTLTQENERLKDTNRELFLRIGQQMQTTTAAGQAQTAESRAETITTADLFKEE